MIRLLTILIFLAGLNVIMAQQRPMQSLYMFDPLLLNPAYAGTQVQLSATAIYRNQWINLEGAPRTMTGTIHSGFLRNKVGLGLIFGDDQIGIHHDVSVYGAYAYRINLSKTTSLSMGIQGGFNNIKSDFNKLNLKNPGDPNLFGVLQKVNPNVGAGLYLRHEDYFLGFSVPYFLNNNIFDFEGETIGMSRQRRYYYLMSGTRFPLADYIDLFPSVLMRFQEQAPLSMDFNTTLVLYKMVGLGLSLRSSDGLIGLFELQLNNNFHVGYSYDFTASDLNQFSAGTHEIMLNYRVKLTRIHKGLECPSYW